LKIVDNYILTLKIKRIINLDVMSEYGPNAWRLYNKTLKTMFDQAEVQLEEIKKQIQNVNLTRKNEQMVAGNKLRSLEQSWIGLVSKNYEIECAIVELEKELIELKKKKMASDANSKQIEESSDVPESTENADQN
jgi:pre-mRNA-splicing factor SPF27